MMIVRPARMQDVDAMYRLAAGEGKGLTNLPPDRDALARRIDISERTLAGAIDDAGDQQVRLVLELDGRLIGVAALWPCVGRTRPLYSYQISEQAQESPSTGRRVTHRMLTMVNALGGASEVGGLLLDPAARGTGAGKLLARSRYLFIARHRSLFADRVFAELRGYQDAAGNSPFWDAVGRHFFDMRFEDAVRLAAIPGHPFIDELSARHPLYIDMLPQPAQEAINRPHDDGRAALAMLGTEGFAFGDYIDLFDAGPTTICETRRIRSIADARPVELATGDQPDGTYLIAAGERAGFRCVRALARLCGGSARVARTLPDRIGLPIGADALALAVAPMR